MIRYAVVNKFSDDDYVRATLEELYTWFDKAYNNGIQWVTEPADADMAIYLEQDDTVPEYGYKISSDGKCAKVLARTGRTVLYGVYGLLEKLFDFTPYAYDEVGFTQRAYDILPQFDITEAPSFPWRLYLCPPPADTQHKNRLRVQDAIWAGPRGLWFHTSLCYLPYEEYGEKHPQWYGEKNEKGEQRQLCYSALVEDEEAYALFLEAAKKVVLENPGKPNLSVTHEDSVTWCECPKCKAAAEKYGAEASTMILFINKLARDIKKWQLEENIKPLVNVVAFAYYRTLPAPVHMTENGYLPNAPEMIMEDNTGIIYAPIEMDYSKTFNHPDNSHFAENIRRWRVLCKNLYIWTYQTNFSNYLAPYDWFPTAQENYQFCRNLGAYLYYDEGQWNQKNSTGFDALKSFVTAKLLWNVDADQQKLIDDFFPVYYGIAAPLVRKYFDEVLENNVRWHTEMGVGTIWYIFFDLKNKDIFHEEDLRRWLDYFEQAKKLIENSDESPERKKVLLHRVQMEKISPQWMYLCLYDTAVEKRSAFIDLLKSLGVARTREGMLVENYAKDWLAE